MRKDKSKKSRKLYVLLAFATIAVLLLCVISAVKEYNGKRINGQEKTAELEMEGTHGSSKDVVINLERKPEGMKIPAGNREKMIRLTIVREGIPVFEIKKEPSENQVDFMEWYLTEPYSYKQLVNVSGLYDFLEHYSSWDCIEEVSEADFQGTGLYVEEEFEDTGVLRLEVGQQNREGNYYVRADYSQRVYEIEKTQMEAMTELKPEDFMMGIASLVYLTTVEKLEIQTKEIKAVFDIETADDNSQRFKREGIFYEEKGFKEMYAMLLSVVITGEAGETEKARETGEPVLSLIFSRNEEQLEDVNINYYLYDEGHYLIEKNGKRQFLAEKEAVEKVIMAVEEYCAR